MATTPVTKTVQLELHIEGAGAIARYSADGAKTNTNALVAFRKDWLGGTPKTISMTVEYEIEVPAEQPKAEEPKSEPKAEPKPEPKPRRTRSKSKAAA